MVCCTGLGVRAGARFSCARCGVRFADHPTARAQRGRDSLAEHVDLPVGRRRGADGGPADRVVATVGPVRGAPWVGIVHAALVAWVQEKGAAARLRHSVLDRIRARLRGTGARAIDEVAVLAALCNREAAVRVRVLDERAARCGWREHLSHLRVLSPMLPALTRPSIRKRLNSFDILNGCTSAHPPGGCSEAVGRLGDIAREGGLRQTHAGRAGARRQTGRPRQLGAGGGIGLPGRDKVQVHTEVPAIGTQIGLSHETRCRQQAAVVSTT